LCVYNTASENTRIREVEKRQKFTLPVSQRPFTKIELPTLNLRNRPPISPLITPSITEYIQDPNESTTIIPASVVTSETNNIRLSSMNRPLSTTIEKIPKGFVDSTTTPTISIVSSQGASLTPSQQDSTMRQQNGIPYLSWNGSMIEHHGVSSEFQKKKPSSSFMASSIMSKSSIPNIVKELDTPLPTTSNRKRTAQQFLASSSNVVNLTTSDIPSYLSSTPMVMNNHSFPWPQKAIASHSIFLITS
jgi:hypothetical protein